MIKITRTDSEKIEGAVTLTLETLLTETSITTTSYEAKQFMNSTVFNILYWFDNVPNLNEIGDLGKVAEDVPHTIIVALDYANNPDENSNVYFITKTFEGSFSKVFTLRGFNRTGSLVKEVGDLTTVINKELAQLGERPGQLLPKQMAFRIMQEAKNEGMEYSFMSFSEDIETQYLYRKMILKALKYIKDPVNVEMAKREIFGWSRALKKEDNAGGKS